MSNLNNNQTISRNDLCSAAIFYALTSSGVTLIGVNEGTERPGLIAKTAAVLSAALIPLGLGIVGAALTKSPSARLVVGITAATWCPINLAVVYAMNRLYPKSYTPRY